MATKGRPGKRSHHERGPHFGALTRIVLAYILFTLPLQSRVVEARSVGGGRCRNVPKRADTNAPHFELNC
jgi:hypothetical protein